MTKGWSWSPRPPAQLLGGKALDLGNPKFPGFGEVMVGKKHCVKLELHRMI